MVLSIFPNLYEMIIGENTDYPEYRDNLFGSVGILTFFISIIFCVLFYVVLGRWKEVWYNRIHWSITIVLLSAVSFGLAILQSKNLLSIMDGYLIMFASFNAIFAVIYFIAFSFLFKNFSIFSKRIPI